MPTGSVSITWHAHAKNAFAVQGRADGLGGAVVQHQVPQSIGVSSRCMQRHWQHAVQLLLLQGLVNFSSSLGAYAPTGLATHFALVPTLTCARSLSVSYSIGISTTTPANSTSSGRMIVAPVPSFDAHVAEV